jgi:hypothetical protein
MSEMLGKMTFFLLNWKFKNVGVQQESKTKNRLNDKNSIFSTFLTWVALEL